MHVDDFDDLAGRFINLALAAILILLLVLIGGRSSLRSLVAVGADLGLEGLVGLEWIGDELLLVLLLALVALVDERSTLAPHLLIIVYKTLETLN